MAASSIETGLGAEPARGAKGPPLRYVPYLYFLRVPLIFAGLLAAIPIFGLWLGSEPNPILGGFFDLNYSAVLLVSLGAFLFGAALSIAATLVLVYGRERFFAAKLPPGHLRPVRLWLVYAPKAAVPFIILFGACSFAVVAAAVQGVDSTHWKARLGIAGVAFILFGLVFFLVAVVWNQTGSGATAFVARRLTWTPFGYLQRVQRAVAPGAWPFRNPPELQPGHGFALLMLAVSVVFYLLFAFGRYIQLHAIELGEVPHIWLPLPTLGSVLVLLGMLCWLFSGLAFLLDRYRVPILLPLAGLLLLTAQFPESDHYFEVRKLTDFIQFAPSDALRPSSDAPSDSAVVVATSGGGIQAAAWTAQVLTGLVKAGEEAGIGDRFSHSIRAISSVSGGSVGTLYFVNAYRDGKVDSGTLQDIVDSAADSSLDEIAWGLVYPDTFRSVAPVLLSPRIDRGWAVERAWLKHLKVPFESSPSLGAWRADARQNKRPAVIFNTTLVETGERFTFPTVDLPKSRGRRSFHDVSGYESLDVSAVTAARLSATFPYVTPVSRANCCPPRFHQYHIADGGYYDNYGLASITELLDQATRTAPPVHNVLLIQILLDKPEFDPPSGGSRGWFFQSYAPIETLSKMRTAAQYSRGETELDLLEQTLAARRVQLLRVAFPYERPDDPHGKRPTPPLSWHLTQAQIDDIKTTWKAYQHDSRAISQVVSFLKKDSQTRSEAK